MMKFFSSTIWWRLTTILVTFEVTISECTCNSDHSFRTMPFHSEALQLFTIDSISSASMLPTVDLCAEKCRIYILKKINSPNWIYHVKPWYGGGNLTTAQSSFPEFQRVSSLILVSLCEHSEHSQETYCLMAKWDFLKMEASLSH